MEEVVHEALEGGGGISEAEGHHQVFELAISGFEGGLGDVIRVDADLVVAGFEVDFAEIFGMGQPVEEFIDIGKGVAVLDCLFIEGTVVDAGPKATVLLLDEKDG
jgi:hypothetical protein